MKVIMLWGPQAVGKVTVGYEIAKLKGYKVLDAHLTMELLSKLFEWGSPQFNKLDLEFYFRILEELAQSDIPGIILTKLRLLNRESDNVIVERIFNFVKQYNHETYEVELYAPLEIRLERNKTPFRLEIKASKRNIPDSEARLRRFANSDLKITSDHPFGLKNDHYLKIDTTYLSAKDTAIKIIESFNL